MIFFSNLDPRIVPLCCQNCQKSVSCQMLIPQEIQASADTSDSFYMIREKEKNGESDYRYHVQSIPVHRKPIKVSEVSASVDSPLFHKKFRSDSCVRNCQKTSHHGQIGELR